MQSIIHRFPFQIFLINKYRLNNKDSNQISNIMKHKGISRVDSLSGIYKPTDLEYSDQRIAHPDGEHRYTHSYKDKIDSFIEERKLKLIDEYFKLEAKSKGLSKHFPLKLEPISTSSKSKQRVKWKDNLHKDQTKPYSSNLERYHSENILKGRKKSKNFNSNINVKPPEIKNKRNSEGRQLNAEKEANYSKIEESSHSRQRRVTKQAKKSNSNDYSTQKVTLTANGNYEKIYIDPINAK